MAIAINSGARGNIPSLKDAVGMLGVLQDAGGNAIELPIKSGYIEGLSPLEYFTGTRGTRKALIDIALKTADAGYLTRRLVDVSQDVFTIEDDASDPGFAMLRADAEEIGVGYGSGWSAALPPRRQGLPEERRADHSQKSPIRLTADDTVDGVKIMSALSCDQCPRRCPEVLRC